MASKTQHDKYNRKSTNSKSLEPAENGNTDLANSQNGGEIDAERGTSCFSCNKTVNEKDIALQCDCCNFWHHITCEKVSVLTYKNLISMKESGVKWYCRKCNLGVQCVLTQIVLLNQRQKETEDRLGYVEEKINQLDSIEERLKKIESKLEETTTSPPVKSYANVTALKKDDIEQIV